MKLSTCSGLLVLAFAISPALPAATIYTAVLNGPGEAPPNASPGTGTATLTLNGNTLTVNEIFFTLTSIATSSFIHCCALPGSNAAVAVPFPGFPAANNGSYNNVFDLTLLATYDNTFVTNNGGTAASAEAALLAGLNAGQAYANIHDATFPGGEIRGQFAAAVPEPATVLLAGATLLMLALLRRR